MTARPRRLALAVVVTLYFLAAVIFPSVDNGRAVVLVAGLPVYAFCAYLCFVAWRRMDDEIFKWQGIHLVALTCSAAFFTGWYWFGRPPLPFNLNYWVPNAINYFMLIGAVLWVEQIFHKK